MRTPILFALGLAAGAAAAHFLDPQSGRKRRAQMRGQAISKVSHAVKPTDKPDDAALAHKVETEIFRASDAPKGSVSVDVQAGVATLRGEVREEQWIQRLGDEAGHVRGVQGVQNLLHTPDEPTPPAEPRGYAAERHAN
jgi:osmotically-inducible protein OsmY